MNWTFDRTKRGYGKLWRAMSITPSRDATVTRAAKSIIAGKDKYLRVEAKTGVPWFFVGCLHSLESARNFKTHLHNGDPLTAKTKRVPAGRPLTGKAPYNWEVSAIDALTMKGLQDIRRWSIERLLYEAERYNGFGYTNRGVNSPYVWAASTQYDKGKYVKDGVFNATAVSQQIGVAPLLAKLSALDTSVKIFFEPTVTAAVKIASNSHGVRWLFVTAAAGIAQIYHETLGTVVSAASDLAFSDVQDQVRQSVSVGQEVAGWFGKEASGLAGWFIVVGLALALYHAWKARRKKS